jgi:hypothetical protein
VNDLAHALHWSSLRTQGPIAPDAKKGKRAPTAAFKRESSPYGSLRSQGRLAERHTLAIPQRNFARALHEIFAPSKIEGAGNAGRPMHPRPVCRR